MNSIEKLIVGLDSVYDMLTSLEKLGSIFDLKLEEDDDTKTALHMSEKGFAVTTQNLSFRYPQTDRLVIDKVNLNVLSGQKVAIAGCSSAGKSTLLQLLSGIYDRYEGRITFNGIPLTALRNDILRLQIGDNIWHETIFKGTVRENITIGRENVTDEMIRAALEAVSATDELNNLDKDLSTELLPGGIKIPKSFASKIILARAIVTRPQLLLLELELDFMRAMEKNQFMQYICDQYSTLIAVSNDRDFLKRCDHVIFMKNGSIVFEGKYNDFKNCEHAESID